MDSVLRAYVPDSHPGSVVLGQTLKLDRVQSMLDLPTSPWIGGHVDFHHVVFDGFPQFTQVLALQSLVVPVSVEV